MKYPLEFRKQPELRLWLSKIDSLSLDYSDGKEEENYLEKCLKKATDLSVDSSELAKFIRDWSSEYHFSPQRNNLLRCLKLKNTDTVLELGAGCGSITRYLGENTSQVIAIEGSQKRARIAALRCRDLDNVNIICSPFQDIELTEKFDIVTLIGVLEYSSKYIDEKNPYQIALENAKKYLKDDGVLIIAIENKLGMKYFAGCSEDHSGLLFDGIEGYPSQHPVQTFGKKELKDLLKLSGFNYQKFLYPFSDYKVPNVILNLDEIEKHNYHEPFIYNWIGYHNSRDYGRYKNEYLHELLLAKQLEKNGLLSQFSNSFLVICALDSHYNVQEYIDNQIFAYKFNTTRYKHFMTGTYLRQLEFNSLVIEKKLLYPHLANKHYENQDNPTLQHKIQTITPFIDGTLLIDLLIKSLKNKTKGLEEPLLYSLKLWHEFLLKESEGSESENGYLSGQYVDCVPWNLIVKDEGKLIYIDQEWDYLEKIEIKFVLFRGLLYFYQMLNPWISEAFKNKDNKDIELTFEDFFKFCIRLLNIDISAEETRSYLKLEFDLQTNVSYLSSKNFSQYLEILKQKTHFLITDFFIEKDKSQLQETQSQLQETQSQLQETQSQLQETQSQLQETQSQVQETQSQLQKAQSEVFIAKETISSMETSKFWKLRKLWFRIKKNNYFSIQKHKNIEIIDNNEFIGNELTSSINIKKTTKKVMLLLWPFIAVGGAETLTLNLLKSSVVKEQFDYVNICLIQQPENLGDLSQEFEKVSCAFYRGSNFSDDNVLGIFHKLRYLINQYQADVLFIPNGSTIFYDLVVQIKSEFPKLRIVNQVYDHQQGWINHYTNNIARSVDYHIAPNQDIKNAYIKYGVSDHNSPIIYHGVDMLEYQENLGNKEEVNLIKKTLNLPIDKIIVTFAARLHPQKRPLDFIEIANYFKNDPRFHFLIVGNGNLFTDVKNKINQLNLLNITQHEFQEDIKKIYLCSDILVVNSEYEGLPIVLLQSLAMNIPVISTAVGGIPDVIKDNYNGILVKKSGDINSFTKGLLKIANNLDDFKQNSREHRKFLEANYSLEIMAQKYLQVFNGEL